MVSQERGKSRQRSEVGEYRIFCDPLRCLGCRTCEISCVVRQTGESGLAEALRREPDFLPGVKVGKAGELNHPCFCLGCDWPLCVFACKGGALSVDFRTNRMVYDENRCVGCWMCVMVCESGGIRPNGRLKVVARCDLCGGDEEPACVRDCPTGALHYGCFDDFMRILEERYGGETSDGNELKPVKEIKRDCDGNEA